MCTGRSVDTVINDCGPHIRCPGASGCKGYSTIRFDLTACAFSALADLSHGSLNAKATYYLSC
jgi:hypothetical protein